MENDIMTLFNQNIVKKLSTKHIKTKINRTLGGDYYEL
jgi:hypothetical protein